MVPAAAAAAVPELVREMPELVRVLVREVQGPVRVLVPVVQGRKQLVLVLVTDQALVAVQEVAPVPFPVPFRPEAR